jgi:hypothetical protein
MVYNDWDGKRTTVKVVHKGRQKREQGITERKRGMHVRKGGVRLYETQMARAAGERKKNKEGAEGL